MHVVVNTSYVHRHISRTTKSEAGLQPALLAVSTPPPYHDNEGDEGVLQAEGKR